jgi:iron complex transport system substrate-binding protein
MKRVFLVAVLLCVPAWLAPVWGMTVTDATGRTVTVPDHIERVLPAGPPAAVLLAAIAPGQMPGFTGPVSEPARGALSKQAAGLPAVPRLTGPNADLAAIKALHPDVIIDYGAVSPRYQQLAQETQEKTGIPTLLLDGALEKIPAVARTLGTMLNQPAQAEAVARMAEAILSLPVPEGTHPSVYYARGADGLLATAPGSDVTAVFTRLGWRVLAPEGNGTFRPATIEAVHKLDPDIIILSDPAAKAVLGSAAWADLRAVRDGHAYLAPAEPFGWVEEPPSVNRLLGLAWLRGSDPVTLAAMFNAIVYDRVLTPTQLGGIAGATPSFKP